MSTKRERCEEFLMAIVASMRELHESPANARIVHNAEQIFDLIDKPDSTEPRKPETPKPVELGELLVELQKATAWGQAASICEDEHAGKAASDAVKTARQAIEDFVARLPYDRRAEWTASQKASLMEYDKLANWMYDHRSEIIREVGEGKTYADIAIRLIEKSGEVAAENERLTGQRERLYNWLTAYIDPRERFAEPPIETAIRLLDLWRPTAAKCETLKQDLATSCEIAEKNEAENEKLKAEIVGYKSLTATVKTRYFVWGSGAVSAFMPADRSVFFSSSGDWDYDDPGDTIAECVASSGCEETNLAGAENALKHRPECLAELTEARIPTGADVAVEHIEEPEAPKTADGKTTWTEADIQQLERISGETIQRASIPPKPIVQMPHPRTGEPVELFDGRGHLVFGATAEHDDGSTTLVFPAGGRICRWPNDKVVVYEMNTDGMILGSTRVVFHDCVSSVAVDVKPKHRGITDFPPSPKADARRREAMGAPPERQPGDVWCDRCPDAIRPEDEACERMLGNVLPDQKPGGVQNTILRHKHCPHFRTEPGEFLTDDFRSTLPGTALGGPEIAFGAPEIPERRKYSGGIAIDGTAAELPPLSEEMQRLFIDAVGGFPANQSKAASKLRHAIRRLEAKQLDPEAKCGECALLPEGSSGAIGKPCKSIYPRNVFTDSTACMKLQRKPAECEPEVKTRFFRAADRPGEVWIYLPDGIMWHLFEPEIMESSNSLRDVVEFGEEIFEAEAIYILSAADWPKGVAALRELIGGSDGQGTM